MSSDFYFHQWLRILERLEHIVDIDAGFQKTKFKEKLVCVLAQKMTGMLASYHTIYNDAVECLRQNLQVQKTMYIAAIIKALVARMLELKHQISKIEGRIVQFFGRGLQDYKLTPFDANLKEVPEKVDREDNVKEMIEEAYRRVEEKKAELERLLVEEKRLAQEALEEEDAVKWWELDNDEQNETQGNKFETYEKVEVLDEETLELRKRVILIQANEKTRQLSRQIRHNKLKREMWTKELSGTLKPQAREDIKERGAQLIQRVMREYFKLKRSTIQDDRRDELMGLTLIKPLTTEARRKNDEFQDSRHNIALKYEAEWKTLCEDLKEKYTKSYGEKIADDVRDELRVWFKTWYKEIRLFYDIPNERSGGSALIVREDVITPSEYKDAYKEYMAKKASDKNKSTSDKKKAKALKKQEAAAKMREEKIKKSLQEKMMKKLMKNPTMHPEFPYPESKQTELILSAIEDYRHRWVDFDITECREVKEKSIKSIDMERICMEVKMEVRKAIDKEMKAELKKLKKALKKDYEFMEEEMPEPMKMKKTRPKKQKLKLKPVPSEHALNATEFLITEEILKKYPKTSLEDFVGDHNYAGDDLRCSFLPAASYAGETRIAWWNRARETILGLRHVLIVGANGSGKSTLVHALASANDAIILELNPLNNHHEEISAKYLKELIDAVASCAKTTQPAVILIKDIQRLFYIKTPPAEKKLNLGLMGRYFVNKLSKKFLKTDQVTFIGTCEDPWLAKSSKLLKRFPDVVMLPDSNYTAVVKLLSDWVLKNRQVPRDLDVHSLAHVLRGYSYQYLQQCLDTFLSAERIVKMSINKLTPLELCDYVQTGGQNKVDYAMYMKWYMDKTNWGRKEKKQIAEQLEFKLLKEKYEANAKKKQEKNAKKLKHEVLHE